MTDAVLYVARSVRLPGLGVLVLPVPPVPGWLAAPPLHTTLVLYLYRPGQPPLPVAATIEEVAAAEQRLERALLLLTDPGPGPASGDWLELRPGIVDFI